MEDEVYIMIFQMASTSAYDKNEVQVYIIAEKEKQSELEKLLQFQWMTMLLNNVRLLLCIEIEKSGKKEKISSPYDEDLLKDGWVCV